MTKKELNQSIKKSLKLLGELAQKQARKDMEERIEITKLLLDEESKIKWKFILDD